VAVARGEKRSEEKKTQQMKKNQKKVVEKKFGLKVCNKIIKKSLKINFGKV
jgi:hypothetical protein